MPRDSRQQPPPPIGRPAPGARAAATSSTFPRDTDLERAAREASAAQPARQGETAAASGGPVRMAFVFFSPGTYGLIEEAATLDEEQIDTWMSRVLYEAARARVHYQPPEQESQEHNRNPLEPNT